eukprot:TRINITY_DN36112_c0_g1_i1.p1 TRINITY_DN36112_c0_g1~~TRINITY_DN36112_c0_g1_i1.p1  ORF type:complete len:189 (+),score=22.71 TRINITY_DN36112_c0_g1_i1:72-638(+)
MAARGVRCVAAILTIIALADAARLRRSNFTGSPEPIFDGWGDRARNSSHIVTEQQPSRSIPLTASNLVSNGTSALMIRQSPVLAPPDLDPHSDAARSHLAWRRRLPNASEIFKHAKFVTHAVFTFHVILFTAFLGISCYFMKCLNDATLGKATMQQDQRREERLANDLCSDASSSGSRGRRQRGSDWF